MREYIEANLTVIRKYLKYKINNLNWRITVFIQTMNINDKAVLEMLNKLIVINRLNKTQILQMVNLVSISNDINDLKENLKWESSKSVQKKIQNT